MPTTPIRVNDNSRDESDLSRSASNSPSNKWRKNRLEANDLIKSVMPHYNEKTILHALTLSQSQHDLSDVQGTSLFVFGSHHRLRVACAKLSKNNYFNNVILLFILASTITLALDTPLENPNGKLMKVLGIIDYCMTGVFTFEALVKIIAFGFIVNKHSYLRNPWNIMDFFVVASALLSIALAGVSFLSVIKIVRVVRIVRVLRPLRVVSKYRGLQIAITCLVKSIPGVLQLQVIVVFALMLFSVLHTMLFSGKFNICNTQKLKWFKHPFNEIINDKLDCINYGGEWVRQDFNFDNFWASFLTLFTIQTQENWVPVMWSEVDAVAPDTLPTVDHNKALILLSIVTIILISTLFLNLFVGVVIETFSMQKEIISKDYLL